MIGIKGWRAGCADGIAAAERQDFEPLKGGSKFACIIVEVIVLRPR